MPQALPPEPTNPGELKKSLIHGLRWVTASRLLAQLVTWGTTFFVIRLLSPTDYGLATLAGVFSNFLSLLNELGFSVTLVQRQARDRETLRNAFGALLLVGVVFSIVLLVGAPALGRLVREPRVVPLMRLVSIQFITMSFSVIPQARLSMDMRFRELSLCNVVSALVGAGTTLLMALNGGGPWSLVVGLVAVNAARALALNVVSPGLFMPRLHIQKIRPLAGFSGLVLLERSLWYWYIQIDTFIVGRMLGAAQLGVYSVGKQLTQIPLERAMEIINSVALPTFARIKTDRAQVRAAYLKILNLGAGYAFPVFWGLAAVSEPLIRLVLGHKWLPAVPVVRLLCISMPLRMLNSLTSAPATGIGRQDVNIKSLIIAIVVIPACIAIGARYGVTGVACAWALGFPIIYACNAALLSRALGIKGTQLRHSIWPAVVAAGVMALGVGALGIACADLVAPWVQLLIEVPAGAALFFVALRIISRDSLGELLRFGQSVLR